MHMGVGVILGGMQPQVNDIEALHGLQRMLASYLHVASDLCNVHSWREPTAVSTPLLP